MADKHKVLLCPKCKKPIQYLREFDLEEVEYHVTPGPDGREYDRNDDYCGDAERTEFVCPECSATLFYSGEKAEAFFRGEEVEIDTADPHVAAFDAVVKALKAAKISLIGDEDYQRFKPLLATIDAAITKAEVKVGQS